MKRFMFTTIAVLGLLFTTNHFWTVSAQSSMHDPMHEKNAFTPDTIPWGPGPPFLNPGAQLAVLEGNPGASSGEYTVRVKMPDGFRISPHWHPHRENVTIISGTFRLGMGDTLEKKKTTAYSQGSFIFLDPDMHHYALASGEVIVQVHGQAPLQFNYVNPDDDPSKNK